MMMMLMLMLMLMEEGRKRRLLRGINGMEKGMRPATSRRPGTPVNGDSDA
jgi:hypothetical protein